MIRVRSPHLPNKSIPKPSWDGLNFYTRTYTPSDGSPPVAVLFVHGFVEYRQQLANHPSDFVLDAKDGTVSFTGGVNRSVF